MFTTALFPKKTALYLTAFTVSALISHGQLNDDFDSYTLNSNIDSQGGWSTAGDNEDTSLTISNTYAQSGTQSLFIVDDSNSQLPRATYTFDAPITQGQFTFSVREDQADSAAEDHWAIKFGGFRFSRFSGKLALKYEGGDTTNTTIGSTSYSTSDWNNFSILFDGTTGAASVSLGGTTIITADNPTYTWSSSYVELGTYSSSNDTDAVYFDTISMTTIPEPASMAGLIGLTALGLSLFRRKRA